MFGEGGDRAAEAAAGRESDQGSLPEAPWHVLAESVPGASHQRSGLPNQDAIRWQGLRKGGFVVCVSDGHGSARYFRSDVGSRLAVEIGIEKVRAFVDRSYNEENEWEKWARLVEHEAQDRLPRDIVLAWRKACVAHAKDNPWRREDLEGSSEGDDPSQGSYAEGDDLPGEIPSRGENSLREGSVEDEDSPREGPSGEESSPRQGAAEEAVGPRDGFAEAVDPPREPSPDGAGSPHGTPEELLQAYGATFLAVVVCPRFVLYLQLGDGDIVILEKGVADFALPRDPRLLANETTSLCGRDAWKDFRVRLDLYRSPRPDLILVATDGYSNSFAADQDFLQVAGDLWTALGQEGVDFVQRSLAEWLAQSSHLGSGDDVSLGLLFKLPVEGEITEDKVMNVRGEVET